MHVIRKDVRFTLKDRRNNNRNYSLSSSHARIAFETFLTINMIKRRLLFISCSDVNNARARNSVFKKRVSTTYGHVWIARSMTYVLVLQRRLSVIERSDA